jgi:hypothetical protein
VRRDPQNAAALDKAADVVAPIAGYRRRTRNVRFEQAQRGDTLALVPTGVTFDSCVSLPRFSPRKLTLGLPGSSGGFFALSSLRWKALHRSPSVDVASIVRPNVAR